MTGTAVIRQSVRPKPYAQPRRSDLAFAGRRPITTVAIAFADTEAPAYRYHAVSTEQTPWSGMVPADTVEGGALDVIREVLADSPGTDTDVTVFTATVAFTEGTATDVIGSRLSVLPEEMS